MLRLKVDEGTEEKHGQFHNLDVNHLMVWSNSAVLLVGVGAVY